MNGRDLIIYILENNLEDEPVIRPDGTIVGFLTVGQAAVKANVGLATIYAWIEAGHLPYFMAGNMIFVRADFKPPVKQIGF